MIDVTILMLESEPSYNHRPNLLESNYKSSMIQFGNPNCIILILFDMFQKYFQSCFSSRLSCFSVVHSNLIVSDVASCVLLNKKVFVTILKQIIFHLGMVLPSIEFFSLKGEEGSVLALPQKQVKKVSVFWLKPFFFEHKQSSLPRGPIRVFISCY